MSLPLSTSIEMPILQELAAIGGRDDVRFLYERLIAYFPQLDEREIADIKNGSHKNWRKAVQKAGRMLDERSCLKRQRGFWMLTEKGQNLADEEILDFASAKTSVNQSSHVDIQRLLIELGAFLGFFAAMEFEYYDVVWRENVNSPRLSHVFEVQHKGNLDSAFAKLKRAYQSQRTKPFLVVSTERDLNRAAQSLTREFQDMAAIVTILTFVQIEQIHRNLQAVGDILPKLLEI